MRGFGYVRQGMKHAEGEKGVIILGGIQNGGFLEMEVEIIARS
jgi:hypothetical protein